MLAKATKPKTCKVCRSLFTPHHWLLRAQVCSPLCGLEFARSKRAKTEKAAQVKDRKETRAKLVKLKSRAQWAKEAQVAVNAYVRARDADMPCISCGRHHRGQYHAGHFLSVGARPDLRFEELNIHKQCAPCNTYLSGNVVLYRQSLIEKIGIDRVEWLEGPGPTRHYSIEDLKAIKAKYAAMARELKARQS